MTDTSSFLASLAAGMPRIWGVGKAGTRRCSYDRRALRPSEPRSTLNEMINRKELAICKRRGHNAPLLGDGWAQCKWCGTWVREVHTIEESEDAPPKGKLGLMSKIEALPVGPSAKKEEGEEEGINAASSDFPGCSSTVNSFVKRVLRGPATRLIDWKARSAKIVKKTT